MCRAVGNACAMQRGHAHRLAGCFLLLGGGVEYIHPHVCVLALVFVHERRCA